MGQPQSVKAAIMINIRHPWYDYNRWTKWRLTYEGGDAFINNYLYKYGERETTDDFSRRKKLTYSPSFAASAVNEIIALLYSRFNDIIRDGGSEAYQHAVNGLDNGVDSCGSGMNYFIGHHILKELLVMQRVGIYQDMPPLNGPTKISNINNHPYLYYYPVEDILSWSIGPNGSYSAILLRDNDYSYDQSSYLPNGFSTRYRYIYLDNGKVNIQYYDESDKSIQDPVILDIPTIPFIMPTIPCSILNDVCNYQIALLNLESSDISYILTANFPFYTEQQDLKSRSQYLKNDDNDQKIQVGTARGRFYGANLERPGFIHPSSEPLKASIIKEDKIKEDIRRLVNLSIQSMSDPNNPTLSGFAYIASLLETTERRIASLWSMYEGPSSPVANIYYPNEFPTYNKDEIDQLLTLADTISSVPYKKQVIKRIALLSLGNRLSSIKLQEIYDDIDSLDIPIGNYKAIAQDIIGGIVSLKTASQARGYPSNDVDQASIDHAQRLIRIQAAQSPNGMATLAPKLEKQLQKENVITNGTPELPVRGEGK